jgi:hypothetical protein
MSSPATRPEVLTSKLALHVEQLHTELTAWLRCYHSTGEPPYQFGQTIVTAALRISNTEERLAETRSYETAPVA